MGRGIAQWTTDFYNAPLILLSNLLKLRFRGKLELGPAEINIIQLR